jgi:predicted phosphodiesterase
MAGIKHLQGSVICEYLEKFPKVQTMTLAKKIYKENKELFVNLEGVRSGIRYYRGTHGALQRSQLKDKKFTLQKPEPPKLPPSEKENKETYILAKANNNILLISDIHAPYHDPEAIELALNYGIEKNVNTIFINGDLLDFHKLSKYEIDPRSINAAHEIKVAKEILEYIRYKFPTQTIIYYMGNHDHRFTKYMIQKAPELLDIPEFDLYHILNLQRLNIIHLTNNRGWKAGKLNGRHGHEFQGGGGVFPARAYYLKANDNIICSHVHTTSEYSIPDIGKSIRGGWTIGCLSDLDPDYNPNNRYNLGFARIEVFSDGNFRVENKRIIGGKVL